MWVIYRGTLGCLRCRPLGRGKHYWWKAQARSSQQTETLCWCRGSVTTAMLQSHQPEEREVRGFTFNYPKSLIHYILNSQMLHFEKLIATGKQYTSKNLVWVDVYSLNMSYTVLQSLIIYYQVHNEQMHRSESVWQRDGHQSSSSDSCPEDTVQVCCHFSVQRHGSWNSVRVNKSGVDPLKVRFNINFSKQFSKIFIKLIELTHHNTFRHE